MANYRTFAHFTLGAKHKKSGLGCQDHSGDYDSYADEKLAIAIVADGHGSPQYFRSDIGARLAVEQSMSCIKAFAVDKAFPPEIISNNEVLDKLRRLAGSIVAAWQAEVEAHEKEHPLKDDEKTQQLEDKYKNRYLSIYTDPDNPKTQHIHHAYGTTLIAVAMAENYWFGLHIGDGKCAALFDDGTWAQPIPWDKRCFLNATTSICDNDVLFGFRYWFGYQNPGGEVIEFSYGPDSDGIDSDRRTGAEPIAIFVGTDGVDDTYPVHDNEKHIRNLYRAVVLSFDKEGFDVTSKEISKLAERLAEQGSQDDVSIAGIVAEQFSPELIEFLRAQDEYEKAEEKAIAERKREEAKRSVLHAEQGKDAKTKKQLVEVAGKEQVAAQDLLKKRSIITELNDRMVKTRRQVEEAKVDADAAVKRLKSIQEEKSATEAEADNVSKCVNAAEKEWAEAEEEAKKCEEQRVALDEKRQSALSRIRERFSKKKET
jgi:hypothetical protein